MRGATEAATTGVGLCCCRAELWCCWEEPVSNFTPSPDDDVGAL